MSIAFYLFSVIHSELLIIFKTNFFEKIKRPPPRNLMDEPFSFTSYASV